MKFEVGSNNSKPAISAEIKAEIKSVNSKVCLARTDGAKIEFSGAHWRPRTGYFTTYTVVSFWVS